MTRPDEPATARNGKPGLSEAAKVVSDRAKRLVDLQSELASLELKEKVGALGAGVALLVGAAVFALYAVGFLFATVAAALATFLSVWLALLVVALFLVAVTAILAAAGRAAVRHGTPPVPEQAIAEARRTAEALRGDG